MARWFRVWFGAFWYECTCSNELVDCFPPVSYEKITYFIAFYVFTINVVHYGHTRTSISPINKYM